MNFGPFTPEVSTDCKSAPFAIVSLVLVLGSLLVRFMGDGLRVQGSYILWH